MICNWVRLFGDYMFTGDCGIVQGLNIRPKQVTCPRCKRRIQRFIEDSTGTARPVTSVRIKRGNAYYFID